MSKRKEVTSAQIMDKLHRLEAEDRHRGRKVRGVIWAMVEKYTPGDPDVSSHVRKIDRVRLAMFNGLGRKVTKREMNTIFEVRP